MRTRSVVLALFIGLCVAATAGAVARLHSADMDYIAVIANHTVEVITSEYGKVQCHAVEYKQLSQTHIIISGQSSFGLTGGMVYRVVDDATPTLYSVYSVWGGSPSPTDVYIDDPNFIIAGICQNALYERIRHTQE